MIARLRPLMRSFDRGERRRLGAFYAVILLLHVVGWGLLLTYGANRSAFVGLGFIAYTFGLRHAFDADHISAIDNTTRKLLQERRRPVGVGFFFSIGHSLVVLLIALLLALTVRAVTQDLVGGRGELHDLGGLIGTAVSSLFLLLIGALNLTILVDTARTLRRVRAGADPHWEPSTALPPGGALTWLFGRLFRLVDASWKMLPIGFLFGLGFDTATEMGLLGISAGAAARGISFLAVLALPIVFAAGMSLVDTTDGAFMAKAYAWAFSNPIRKILYNLTVTSLSVFVAVFVGLMEATQILAQVLGLQGHVWALVAGLDFETLGLLIVAAFVVTWAGSFVFYRLARVESRSGHDRGGRV